MPFTGHTEETRRRISETCKARGVGKWMAGRPRDLVAKEKQRATMNKQVAEGTHHLWKGGKRKDCVECSSPISRWSKTGKCLKCAPTKGSEHWAWKGGITPLNHLVRSLPEYKKWRDEARVRDDFTCQDCGKHGGDLHVDHVEAFAVIMNKHGIDSVQAALVCADLWDLANARTLCVSCHSKTPTFGRPKKVKT